MVRVLIAGLVAMVLAIVIGPTFIEWLRRAGVGQQIREEGPARHIVKQGTPTMGGLLILATAVVPFLVLSKYTLPGLALLFLTVGCAAIGFTDDYLKVRKRRSLGLSGRWKMVGLVLITIGVGWVVTQVGYLDTEIYFPIIDVNIDLGWFYFPFLFVVIAGTANGVNLTDGIDGLAAGTCAISLLTFLAIAAISWIRSGRGRLSQRQLPRRRDLRGRADRRRDRLPLVQRLPGRGVHGRHRLDGPRRRDRRARRDDPDRGAPDLHRRHLPDRGALGDDPGCELQAHRASASS